MASDKLSITRDEVNALPLWHYEGPIVLLRTPKEIAAAATRLQHADLIGFDTESRPSFTKGVTYPVALLQLAVDEVVYLLRLNRVGLPANIAAVLEDPERMKVGIAPHNDLRELHRDFDCRPQNVVALEKVCRALGYTVSSARKLTALILGRRISKRQRTSNWAQPTLTPAQIRYAATDAWVCQEMYRRLRATP